MKIIPWLRTKIEDNRLHAVYNRMTELEAGGFASILDEEKLRSLGRTAHGHVIAPAQDGKRELTFEENDGDAYIITHIVTAPGDFCNDVPTLSATRNVRIGDADPERSTYPPEPGTQRLGMYAILKTIDTAYALQQQSANLHPSA